MTTTEQVQPSKTVADIYRELLAEHPEHKEELKAELLRKASKKIQA